MHKSKFLALLLAVVMVASMIVVPVYAADDAITYGLEADKTEVAPGEAFVVTVSMDTNPGFTAAGVAIDYSTGLTITERNEDLVYETGLRKGNPTFSQTLDAKPQKVVLASASAIDATGDLLALTFVAAAEGTYEISLSIPEELVQWDADKQPLDTVLAPKLTITVAESTAAKVECEKCGEENWTPVAAGAWNSETALDAGHYQLTGDQNLTSELAVAGEVCIDLNGHKITADVGEANHRNFNVAAAGTLVIMDSGKNGTISGGKVATPDEETGYVPEDGEHGGNIYAEGDLYIYGGTITGGTAQRGGNIYVRNCTLYMYGGTVTLGNAYRGGNIEVSGDGNIYDGTISEGKANWGAANLAVQSGSTSQTANTLNIYNVNISGGSNKSTTRGNVVNVNSKLNIYGVDISATRALQTAGAKESQGVTYIYGGDITGTVTQGDTNCTTQIYNGAFNTDVSAYLAECACVFNNTVWQPAENCNCAYTAALGAYGEYITPQTGEHTAAYSGTGYACKFCDTPVEAPSTKQGECACEDHGDQPWEVWTGTQTSGHFYVLSDLALSDTVTVNDGETLCLDLNGQTVSHSGTTRMFVVKAGGTLNLMDSAKNGTLQGKRNSYSGSVINCAGTFNLYSGTIQDGHTRSSSNMAGGNIQIDGGTFNMTGGTIKNGKVQSTNAERYATGGNIYITGANAVANISGGVIEGGTCVSDYSQRGGNISVANGAQVTISGDAIISGGQAALGESIYMRNAASDVVIKSGVTIGAGVDPEVADIFVDSGKLMTYEDPAALQGNWMAYNTTKDKDEVTCYVTYATLTDALGAADEGDTVNLAADIPDAGDITLTGVTLNLNGHDLTATSVDALDNGNVIDSTNGNGKVVSNDVMFNGNNTMVPVTTADGTVFEKADITEGWLSDEYDPTKGATTGKYIFYINPLKNNTLMDDAMLNETNALKLGVKVTWSVDGGEEQSKIFNLDSAKLETFVKDKWDTSALVLTLTNLEGVTIHSVEAVIESNGTTVYNANNG